MAVSADFQAVGRRGLATESEKTGGAASFAVRIVGLGCLLSWTYLVFFSKLVHYSTRNDISHLNSTYTFACLGIIAATLAAALLERLGRDGDSVLRDVFIRRSDVAAAALLAASTIVLSLVERGLFTQPWCNITSTFAGICLGILFLGWARVTSRDRAHATLRLSCAFVFAACLFAAILYLPDLTAIALTTLLPMASLVCLARANKPGDKVDANSDPPVSPRTPEGSDATFRRGVAMVCMLAFAESLMRALFLEVSPVADTVVYRWMMVLAAVLGAGLVFGASKKWQGWAPAAGLSKVTLFALVVLFALAPLLKGCGISADLVVSVCYVVVNLALWTAMAQICAVYRLPCARVFGVGLGVVYMGFLAGTFTGDVLASFFALDMRALEALTLLSSALVLAAFLFVADEKTVVRLMSAGGATMPQERFMRRCEEVANTYGLSPKETEVMALAAHGRTNQRIQEALGISAGTVNTHFTRIYKKLGIHSRQEMLDLIEEGGE